MTDELTYEHQQIRWLTLELRHFRSNVAALEWLDTKFTNDPRFFSSTIKKMRAIIAERPERPEEEIEVKPVNGQSKLTIAFIAIGAVQGRKSLSDKDAYLVADNFDGVVGLIDEATHHWTLVETLYKKLTIPERDLFGCWDYEVSEAFGREFVIALSNDSAADPKTVLRDVVVGPYGITERRFNELLNPEKPA